MENISIIIFGFFIIIMCLLLILMILVQNPKKESIHQSFMEKNFRFFGIKRTNTFLENITWILSIIIFFLILFFNFFLKSKH
ncbi:preprotein translocase subunit SecG [Blattabacterium sp. DPU]|uniref:preprotein translocase subunit SecG n=1 Tax=Blattabacterium sp. DPU TaxID=2715232 RepID=UPI00140821AC|nr:preprotein translocase subunit SecG [Blattabacterium sp. DPU]QIK16591.1 preprotein translocase subunit SecG [Blattabacterium sp. DPU]